MKVHSLPVPPDDLERRGMARFCEQLTPEDWLALEALDKRLRDALLKQTIRIALRWRARRARRASQR